MSDPAPAAPAFGELFELSLTALVNAPGVFARLEARPPPGPGASVLVALAWGTAFFTLNLIHLAIASPAALQAYAPWVVAVVGILGLGIWAALTLLGASLVYGLGRALGSVGDFDRALLITALTLAAAPAQALCSWFPIAWILPPVVAAWILACGLNAMFKADPWAARGICAALAAGVLALQYGAGLVMEKYSPYGSGGRSPTDLGGGTSSPYGSGGSGRESALALDASQLVLLQQQMKPVQSSLDLLRGPDDSRTPPTGPSERQQLAAMSASGDAMNKGVVNMLDSIAPILNNPAITQNMTLQQKSDYAELKKMISELKSGMAANTITSAQEQQAKMLKIQLLVMRLMGVQK